MMDHLNQSKALVYGHANVEELILHEECNDPWCTREGTSLAECG
jgi:hypothetical protein